MTESSGEPGGGYRSERARVGWKSALAFVTFACAMPASLFAAAGRVNWPMGWAFTGSLLAFVASSRLLAARNSPDILAERAGSWSRPDVRGWDRAFVPAAAVFGPLAACVVAGLDRRFGWSPKMPLALQVGGLVVAVLGYLLGAWAMASNRFYSAVVRVQRDRGHIVETGGPYRYIRHPGYASAIPSFLATGPALGSLWALIPSGLVALLVVVRTVFEDRLLRSELPGYEGYARRVRYRLIPGVW